MPIEGEAVGAEFTTAAANIKLDCDGSATFSADASSPTNDCCVCRRNAARPSQHQRRIPGTSGTSPSADGDNPAADNSVDASGFTSESGAGCTSGMSWAVVDVGQRHGSRRHVDNRSLIRRRRRHRLRLGLYRSGRVRTGRLRGDIAAGRSTLARPLFGFFGVDAVADVSEPDFLSLIVAAAGFLPVPLL